MNEIVTIHNKQYKSVLPCGLLRTQTGHTYFLLHPEPVVKDSWQRDGQQRFVVVPDDAGAYEEYEFDTGRTLHTYTRHLVTTNPDIEYCNFRSPILVEYLNELDVEKTMEIEQDFDSLDFPPPDLSTEEWEKLLQNAEEAKV